MPRTHDVITHADGSPVQPPPTILLTSAALTSAPKEWRHGSSSPAVDRSPQPGATSRRRMVSPDLSRPANLASFCAFRLYRRPRRLHRDLLPVRGRSVLCLPSPAQ